jgi:hypothetical protein
MQGFLITTPREGNTLRQKALSTILWVFCFPIVFVIGRSQEHKQQVLHGLRPRGRPPRGIKTCRRRRPLTQPPGQVSSRQSRTKPQCLLLAHLPLELRQLIWIEFLGGMTIHLTIQDHLKSPETLGQTKCSLANGGACDEFGDSGGRLNHQSVEYMHRKQLISILLTCRTV